MSEIKLGLVLVFRNKKLFRGPHVQYSVFKIYTWMLNMFVKRTKNVFSKQLLEKKIKRRVVIFCRAFFSFVILCFYFYPFNKRSFIEKHVHEYEKMCVLIYEFVHYLIYYFSKCWINWKGIGLGLVGSPETTFFKCKKKHQYCKET